MLRPARRSTSGSSRSETAAPAAACAQRRGLDAAPAPARRARMNWPRVLARAARVKGLCSTASMPASRQASAAAPTTWAVSATIGVRAHAALGLSRADRRGWPRSRPSPAWSRPSAPGRSARSRAASTASRPSHGHGDADAQPRQGLHGHLAVHRAVVGHQHPAAGEAGQGVVGLGGVGFADRPSAEARRRWPGWPAARPGRGGGRAGPAPRRPGPRAAVRPGRGRRIRPGRPSAHWPGRERSSARRVGDDTRRAVPSPPAWRQAGARAQVAAQRPAGGDGPARRQARLGAVERPARRAPASTTVTGHAEGEGRALARRSLATRSSPPMASTSRLQMARPRPVPPNRRVVDWSAWLKAPNSAAILSLAMPMPVSRTATRRPPAGVGLDARSARRRSR